jgi:D-arabinan exo alpha-(1,3)/(1,5)-arabinofuranosidase (non-reducing end)
MLIRSQAITLALLALPAHAERLTLGPGDLASVILPRRGRAMSSTSADPSGGNLDFRIVPPGGSITILDYRGAGIVRRFHMTLFPRDSFAAPELARATHRQLILRMYWDGEKNPSVESPVGDFFGVGFGEQRDYVSLPLSVTSGGYNCYWPMPFRRAARWTLTNLSGAGILAFWNIDFTAERALPKDVLHFHVQWRRENPTTAGRSYTVLEASGRGHFVGVALFMRGISEVGSLAAPLAFLEGDEQIVVDGAATPAVAGTGTEDYFNGGWYFERGPFSSPYAGAVIRDEATARVSAYRWHIEDAVPFRSSIRVTIEHGAMNDAPADYSSVAYFYQREPHAPFPPLPDAASLLP